MYNSADAELLQGSVAPGLNLYSSSVLLVLFSTGYWCMRPAGTDDDTLVKLTPFCDKILVPFWNWLCCKVVESQPWIVFTRTFRGSGELGLQLSRWHNIAGQIAIASLIMIIWEILKCSKHSPSKPTNVHDHESFNAEIEDGPAMGNQKDDHGSNEVIGPELARQHRRAEQVTTGLQNSREVANDWGTAHSRGDTLSSSDLSDHNSKFHISSPTSLDSHILNSSHSLTQGVHGRQSECDLTATESHQKVSEDENSDSHGTVRSSSGEAHLSLDRQQSYNTVHEPNNEVDKMPSECATQGQDETMGGVKNEQFVSETNVVSGTHNSKASNGPAGINPTPPLLGHSDTSGIGSLASGLSASTVQSRADNDRPPSNAPSGKQAVDHKLPPGDKGAVKRTEVNRPVQESGFPCSGDLVLAVPGVPRRIGLVLLHDLSYVH